MLRRSSLILSPGPYGQFYHRANSDIVSSFGIKIAENKESEPDWKRLERFLSDVRSSSQSSRILLCAIRAFTSRQKSFEPSVYHEQCYNCFVWVRLAHRELKQDIFEQLDFMRDLVYCRNCRMSKFSAVILHLVHVKLSDISLLMRAATCDQRRI